MGMNPLCVTATTDKLSGIGRANIENLKGLGVDYIEVTPNPNVRRRINKLALLQVGDISWPEHAAIFSTPFKVAADLGINLIMYGENPQHQYGGPEGTEDAVLMTERWVQEFGGFLGLRPADFVGVEGITNRDMQDYEVTHRPGIEAHFLGQYEKWDSKRNAAVALKAGMFQQKPCDANWWKAENLDNAQTGIHDQLMYRKYGYGRGATQIAVDVRGGNVTADQALHWIHSNDGLFPHMYGGVFCDEIIERIGMEWDDFIKILNQFTNKELFDGEKDLRPLLKC